MKVTLAQVRRMGIYEEIAQPEKVYHMTDRKNLENIIKDGKIKSKADYMTFFFPSIEDIPIYIELTGADTGRQYWDFDGKIHTAPPLNHAETVVLKLAPRGRQKMEWYRETINKTNTPFPNEPATKETARKLWEYMNNARICHYGSMPFEKNPEIIELSEIDKMPESDSLKEIRRLKRGLK